MPKGLMKASTTATCLGLFILFILRITLTCVSNSTIAPQGNDRWKEKSKRAKRPPQSERSKRIACDVSHEDYDLCSIDGPVLLNPTTTTLYALNAADSTTPIKTRPYPRKSDTAAMSNVQELTLSSSPRVTATCGVTHDSPALVFSAGGYTGNFFHDFNDGFVPLFVTLNSLFPDRDDVVLVIANCRDHWLRKYALLLRQFSRLPVISFDRETATHCFASVVVGLIKHGQMTVNPTKLPSGQTLGDFSTLLGKAYSTNDGEVNLSQSRWSSVRPRLVLVGRKGNVGRAILNQEEVIAAAEEVGFDVIRFEPSADTSLAKAFGVIHTSHAMLGVHGAALTHSLFLRPGSVMVQVVPIGTNWLSQTYFATPARELGFEYIEYMIRPKESSLADMYGSESLVVKDPSAFHKGNWTKMRVYLKDQNVKLDLVRLKKYLKRAYEMAKRFMDRES